MDTIGYYIVAAIVIGGFVLAYFATKNIMKTPSKSQNLRRQERRKKRR